MTIEPNLRDWLEQRLAAHEAKSSAQLERIRREITEDVHDIIDNRVNDVLERVRAGAESLESAGKAIGSHETQIRLHEQRLDQLQEIAKAHADVIGRANGNGWNIIKTIVVTVVASAVSAALIRVLQ